MKYRITLKGRIYEVEVSHTCAMLADEYAAYQPAAPAVPSAPAQQVVPTPPVSTSSPAALQNGEVISAPMPGNILRIEVTEGQAVKAGDVLVILEAMKMENEIVASTDGTVVQIAAEPGAKVETGSPLVVLS